ncbi:MAG: hypothetical protein ACRERD_21015, partial [Candidatus Binatia bacterium]
LWSSCSDYVLFPFLTNITGILANATGCLQTPPIALSPSSSTGSVVARGMRSVMGIVPFD